MKEREETWNHFKVIIDKFVIDDFKLKKKIKYICIHASIVFIEAHGK